MKVATAEANVLGSSGLKQTQGFTINASAHAFKMLSSGLYSDKIGAVLREIACNAFDAHVEAGCGDRPIRVKLPNALDDQFYVQDWGPGLSHDEVMNLYTSYFSSTKQSSNDYTGAFGLGSKSPFSYTDSFAVASAHEGKKRTYSLYLGNDGAPKISLMATEPTDSDWESGMRVGFAVRPNDYIEFENKAREIYKWFRVLPDVRGVKAIKAVEYRYEGDEYALLKESDGETHAVMGNVHYPLDMRQLSLRPLDGGGDGDILNYASELKGLVLRLPIGAVQVAANREQLQYDPESLKNIKARLRAGLSHLGREVIDKVNESVDESWETLCDASDLAESLVGQSGLRWKFPALAKCLGADDKKAKLLSDFIGKDTVPMPGCLGKKSRARVVRREKHSRSRSAQSVVVFGGHRSGSLVYIEKSTVIAVGLESHAVSRAKLAVDSGTYEQVIVIGGDKKKKFTATDLVNEAQQASKALRGMKVIALSDLPAPAAAAVKKKKRPKNWTPSLPAAEFVAQVEDKEVKSKLGDLPDQLYACFVEKSRWGNTSQFMRIFEKTAEDDMSMSWGDWENIWKHYCHVQKAARIPKAPQSWATVTGAEVRSICLPQLGWKNAYEAVVEYMKNPQLQTELRKQLGKKHLLAPEGLGAATGWMTALAWWLGQNPRSATVKLLEDKKVADQLRDMLKARKAKNIVIVPPAIQSYQWMVRRLSMADDLAGDVAQALTVEDVDAAFAKRFPVAQCIEYKYLDTEFAEQLITAVLSKEA